MRTTGYLPGPNDVYVPLGMVKKYGLRKGDAVTGAVKAHGRGRAAAAAGARSSTPLVRLDTVNGMSPEDARSRVEFGKLTPLYPQERLRLETEPNILTTRIIDLVAPIGKGQRGLIVAPAKAGKTMVMQAHRQRDHHQQPRVPPHGRPGRRASRGGHRHAARGQGRGHLLDLRPARPSDHTTVAELAIERAKRLVELGHDVVVLLDSITRLGRAYNLAAPASGRILSGGVDSRRALPAEAFFGAARNIEDGGSLTILATALVETGSQDGRGDLRGVQGHRQHGAQARPRPRGQAHLPGGRRQRLRHPPRGDPAAPARSCKIIWKLRRVLAALDQQQGIELLLDRLKKTKSNVEFLTQVQKTSSIQMDDRLTPGTPPGRP